VGSECGEGLCGGERGGEEGCLHFAGREGAGGTAGWVGRWSDERRKEKEWSERAYLWEDERGFAWTWSTDNLDDVGPSAQWLGSSLELTVRKAIGLKKTG